MKFGGSVAKNTYVEGLSDVDVLVLLKKDYADQAPGAIKEAFTDILRTVFGHSAVSEGNLAVTVTVGGNEIQLLPAVRDGEHYKISDVDGKTWAPIRPRKFAEQLTSANIELDGKLVPTIKLAKAVMATLPEQRRLSGYHIEALAIRAFRDYEGMTNTKEMLQHFFETVPQLIKSPVQDVTKQSKNVDEYLGPKDSMQRIIVADALERISRRIKNANGSRSVPGWSELLSEGTP